LFSFFICGFHLY